MHADRGARRGFALITALLAMLCLAALLTGLAFTAREDHALTTAMRDSRRAFAAAELAAWSAMTSFDSSHLELPVGGETQLQHSASVDAVEGRLRRLGTTTFLALGTGGVPGRGGDWLVRRSGLLFSATRDSAGSVLTIPTPGLHWFQP